VKSWVGLSACSLARGKDYTPLIYRLKDRFNFSAETALGKVQGAGIRTWDRKLGSLNVAIWDLVELGK
jgi:hypothetical protein